MLQYILNYKGSFFIYHVIGFSDLVDLWVIKIKKPMILCARSTRRSHIVSMRNVFFILLSLMII